MEGRVTSVEDLPEILVKSEQYINSPGTQAAIVDMMAHMAEDEP
jgi:hypothetical protein